MPALTLDSGATVAYGAAGDGAPLVLVHGSPGEGRSWGRVAKQLGGGLKILTPDLPGYGGSTEIPADTAPEARTAAMAAAVSAVVRAAGSPVWLCGHSYGGNVAIHAAAADPASVRGLVLLEPVFFRALGLAGDEATAAPATAHFRDYVGRVRGGEPEAVRHMIDYWFGAGAFAAMPPPVRQFLSGAAPRNAIDVEASLADALPLERLRTLTMPVAIAFGGASPPVAPAIARALGGLLSTATVEAIDGATHGMVDGHPAEVAAILRRMAGV